MKVAITGSSGHLGRVVVETLLLKYYEVKALMYEDRATAFNSDVEIINGDVTNVASLNNFVDGCETVIHCAAKISMNSNKDISVYETNVEGTKNIFNAALKNGVKKFIYISSIHTYDQSPKSEALKESRNYCNNNAPRYDRSKRDAQKFVLENAGKGMEVVVLNPTSIVGPPDHKPSLAGKAIIDIYNKEIPALLNGGFDFCDVRDVAKAVVNSIELGKNGQTYLLSGKWYHIKEVADLVGKAKGEKQFIPVLPTWIGYASLPFSNLIASLKKSEPLFTKESIDTIRNGNKNISSAKASADLNYHCRPLDQTITDLITWFKQYGNIK